MATVCVFAFLSAENEIRISRPSCHVGDVRADRKELWGFKKYPPMFQYELAHRLVTRGFYGEVNIFRFDPENLVTDCPANHKDADIIGHTIISE